MKKLYLLTLLFCSFAAFGQMRAVSQKVQQLNAMNQKFESYNLFSKNNDVQKASKYLTSATDVTVLNLNSNELERLTKDAPMYLTVSIPYQNEMVNVELYKETVLTDDFIAKDEQGNVIDYKPGKYYRGVVNGDYTSLVAISFFDHNVMGVISTYEKGNIVLGQSVDGQDFITYSDKNLLGENPFVCGVDELPENQQAAQEISYDPSMASKMTTENCVRIYYEVAYKPYALKGSNVTATLDWLTGIQNNIGTLYSNDNINVVLHAVKVWTIQDPYNGTYSENLAQFRDTLTDFDGDLAHLVNYPTTNSVAYLNSLCTDINYAYSGISMTYAQVPTYSWTIMAMTHEMGHALGSQHTHACAWNGNNSQIDGCGPTAGQPDPNNGNCATGPLPTNGGTIMSYCHLLPSVGINFLNGFGPQPAALIRTTVDSKPCLGSDCVAPVTICTYAIQNVNVTYLENNSIQVHVQDNSSSKWNYQVIPLGTTSDNWQTTTSADFTVSNLADNQYYILRVVNVCDGGVEGGMAEQIILTGGFCDGSMFTDTGGANGTYGNNEHFVKTFYPNADGAMVKLTFDRIGLQANDVMRVYNGTTTASSSLFAGGNITGNNNPGPEFTSTDASGAITIEFTSNGSGNAYGWEAYVDCGILSVEDMSNSNGISVYPNPASSVLNIDAKKEILSVQLTDAAGRTVLTNNVNNAKGTINVSHLPKGVYILSVKMKDQTVTKKIIKK